MLMPFKALVEDLCTIYDERQAQTIVQWLAEDAFGIYAPFSANIMLSHEQKEALAGFRLRLLQHEPLAYITGKPIFMAIASKSIKMFLSLAPKQKN